MAARKLLSALVALSASQLALAEAAAYSNDTVPTPTGSEYGGETGGPDDSAAVSAAVQHGGPKDNCRWPPVTIEICGKHCPGQGYHVTVTETISIPYTITVNDTTTVTETKSATTTTTTTESTVSVTTDVEVTTDYVETTTTEVVTTSYPYTITVSKCHIPTVTPAADVPGSGIGIRRTHPEECVISTTTKWTTVVETSTYVTTKTEVQVSPTTTTDTTTATTTATTTDTETETDTISTTVFESTTLYSTVTVNTSYPVTVISDHTIFTTVPTTIISTITTSYPVPTTTTETEIDTTTDTTTEFDTISTTIFESTTLYSTVTVNTSYPVTVISDHTIFTTVPTTIISTITTSYPVPTTITETETDTTTDTMTLPGSVTTLPGEVTTLPGTTSLITVTTTIPPVTTTITESGTTVTTVLPGTTSIVTVTITGPPVTITQPPETITLSTTIIGTVTTCAAPQNTAGSSPPVDALSDLTWGCKPGFVCSPGKPDSCNVWADSPADDFTCRPSDCIPSPNYPVVQWPANETGYYPPTDGYFNLAPLAFGLSYDIFEEEVIIQKVNGHLTSIVTGNWASQSTLTHYPPASTEPPSSYPHHKPKAKGNKDWKRDSAHIKHLSKRDETICPAVCYDTCNNCYLEAQAVGKSPALCSEGSPFKQYYDACQDCIAKNAPDVKVTTKAYLEPKFFQFLNFCDAQEAQPQTTNSGPQSQQSTPPNVVTNTQGQINTNTGANPITSTSQPEGGPSGSGAGPTQTTNPPVPSETGGSEGGGSASGGGSSGGGSSGAGGAPGGGITGSGTGGGGGSGSSPTGSSTTSPIVTINDGFRPTPTNVRPLFLFVLATILLL